MSKPKRSPHVTNRGRLTRTRIEIMRELEREDCDGPECAPRSSDSASSRSDETSAEAVAKMQLALLEAVTDLAAHWGQAGRGDEAELLHGVVDELLDLEAKLDEDDWPVYYAARTATRILLKKKNPAAVALGRRGGKKGGKSRMEKLTPAERTNLARKAARKRWGHED